MDTIRKFPLHDAFKIVPFPVISMPVEAQILKVDNEGNTAVIYAVVDTVQESNEQRNFALLPTGANMASMPETPVYLGTVGLNNGTLILHIFELIKSENNETNGTGNSTADATEISEPAI